MLSSGDRPLLHQPKLEPASPQQPNGQEAFLDEPNLQEPSLQEPNLEGSNLEEEEEEEEEEEGGGGEEEGVPTDPPTSVPFQNGTLLDANVSGEQDNPVTKHDEKRK